MVTDMPRYGVITDPSNESTFAAMAKLGVDRQNSRASKRGYLMMDVSPKRRVADPGEINYHDMTKDIFQSGLKQHEHDFARRFTEMSTAPIFLVMGTRAQHLFENSHAYIRVVATVRYPLLRSSTCYGSTHLRASVARVYRTAADMRSGESYRMAFFVPHPSCFRRNSAHRVRTWSHVALAIERFVDVACILAFGYLARPTIGSLMSARSMYMTSFREGKTIPFSTF
jgi:hypothetical protein